MGGEVSPRDTPRIVEMIGCVMQVREGVRPGGTIDQRLRSDFEIGLELILDGLDRMRSSSTTSTNTSD